MKSPEVLDMQLIKRGDRQYVSRFVPDPPIWHQVLGGLAAGIVCAALLGMFVFAWFVNS